MNDPTHELAKQAQNLGKQTGGDHVANIVKAALNAVPVVGGPIASLIDDYIPESRQKRVEKFSQDLADELSRVQESLDEGYVKTEEFAYLFTRVYQNVVRDYQQEKLDAYRNILVNSLRVDLAASVQERFLTLVEQLSPLHLRVLSAFISDEHNSNVFAQNPNRSSMSIGETLRILLPELPEGEVVRCVFDLDQMGITNRVHGLLTGTMTEFGARQLEGRLTAFGREFVDFVLAN